MAVTQPSHPLVPTHLFVADTGRVNGIKHADHRCARHGSRRLSLHVSPQPSHSSHAPTTSLGRAAIAVHCGATAGGRAAAHLFDRQRQAARARTFRSTCCQAARELRCLVQAHWQTTDRRCASSIHGATATATDTELLDQSSQSREARHNDAAARTTRQHRASVGQLLMRRAQLLMTWTLRRKICSMLQLSWCSHFNSMIQMLHDRCANVVLRYWRNICLSTTWFYRL